MFSFFQMNSKQPNEKLETVLVLSFFECNQWMNEEKHFTLKWIKYPKSRRCFFLQNWKAFLIDWEAMWSMPSEGRKPNEQDLKAW